MTAGGDFSEGIAVEIEARRLTPDLLTDYLEYFDHIAFSDNPDWAGCYCYFYLVDQERDDWNSRSGQDNRRDVAGLISRGEMHGYLAYVDGHVLGWCHAGPKTYFPSFGRDPDLADADLPVTGSIACFNVAPGRRRLGIASALLDAATRGLAGLGMTIAEAYPHEGASSDAGHYTGPLDMYLRAGFTIHKQLEGSIVVRKELRSLGRV